MIDQAFGGGAAGGGVQVGRLLIEEGGEPRFANDLGLRDCLGADDHGDAVDYVLRPGWEGQ